MLHTACPLRDASSHRGRAKSTNPLTSDKDVDTITSHLLGFVVSGFLEQWSCCRAPLKQICLIHDFYRTENKIAASFSLHFPLFPILALNFHWYLPLKWIVRVFYGIQTVCSQRITMRRAPFSVCCRKTLLQQRRFPSIQLIQLSKRLAGKWNFHLCVFANQLPSRARRQNRLLLITKKYYPLAGGLQQH